MVESIIERKSDLRKRVRLSIPKLIKEILDKDILYFNIKLEKLCNIIVLEMGYESLLRIHEKIKIERKIPIGFNLTERNSTYLNDMVKNSLEKTENEYFRCLLSTYCNFHPAIRERIIKRGIFTDIERAIENKLKLKISYSGNIVNVRVLTIERDSKNEYNCVKVVNLDTSETIIICIKDVEILNVSI